MTAYAVCGQIFSLCVQWPLTRISLVVGGSACDKPSIGKGCVYILAGEGYALVNGCLSICNSRSLWMRIMLGKRQLIRINT